jgi:hypothetical protein
MFNHFEDTCVIVEALNVFASAELVEDSEGEDLLVLV